MNKPEIMSTVEWQARCDLAALYRLIAHFRMTDLIDTHLTLRVPGPEHHFLINRYGVLFNRMKASDLVLIDQHGKVVDSRGTDLRVNAAGFVIHSAVHMARPDLMCVIHTHTAAGIAVAAQEQGRRIDSRHSSTTWRSTTRGGATGRFCPRRRPRVRRGCAINGGISRLAWRPLAMTQAWLRAWASGWA